MRFRLKFALWLATRIGGYDFLNWAGSIAWEAQEDDYATITTIWHLYDREKFMKEMRKRKNV